MRLPGDLSEDGHESWDLDGDCSCRGDLNREVAMGTSMLASGNRVGLKRLWRKLIELQKEIYTRCVLLIGCKKYICKKQNKPQYNGSDEKAVLHLGFFVGKARLFDTWEIKLEKEVFRGGHSVISCWPSASCRIPAHSEDERILTQKHFGSDWEGGREPKEVPGIHQPI